jgi:hypothetical protein
VRVHVRDERAGSTRAERRAQWIDRILSYSRVGRRRKRDGSICAVAGRCRMRSRCPRALGRRRNDAFIMRPMSNARSSERRPYGRDGMPNAKPKRKAAPAKGGGAADGRETKAQGAPARAPKAAAREAAKRWCTEIERYDRGTQKWRERAGKIEKKYLDEDRSTDSTERRFAILWANTETMKPATFARRPAGGCLAALGERRRRPPRLGDPRAQHSNDVQSRPR